LRRRRAASLADRSAPRAHASGVTARRPILRMTHRTLGDHDGPGVLASSCSEVAKSKGESTTSSSAGTTPPAAAWQTARVMADSERARSEPAASRHHPRYFLMVLFVTAQCQRAPESRGDSAAQCPIPSDAARVTHPRTLFESPPGWPIGAARRGTGSNSFAEIGFARCPGAVKSK
jgi:hypothetical protein